MARISKHELSEEMIDRITQQFTKSLGTLDGKSTGPFISSFFGKEEKLMFAKRLAIIIMIHEGATGYEIANALLVSQATVGKLVERYDRGDFRQIVSCIKKEKVEYLEFLNLIDTILTLGLPHYSSKDRWKILSK